MHSLPLFLVAGLVLWATLQRRLYKSAQPLRLVLAEKGERLLAHPQLPEDLRRSTRLMLSTALSGGWLIIGSIVLLAPFAVMLLLRSQFLVTRNTRLEQLPDDLKTLYRDFIVLHGRILLANHPILSVIFITGSAIIFSIAGVISGLIHGDIPRLPQGEFLSSVMGTPRPSFTALRS